MGLGIRLLPTSEKDLVAAKHVKFSSNFSKIYVNHSYCLNLNRLELEAKSHSK
ncbi:hypothetical protein Hanom_Chr08g00732951 [Helianthus anomalus]